MKIINVLLLLICTYIIVYYLNNHSCHRDICWAIKSKYEFGVSFNEFYKLCDYNGCGRDSYLRVMAYRNEKCIPGSEKYSGTWKLSGAAKCLFLSAEQNDVTLVNYFVNKEDIDADDIYMAIIHATKKCHFDMVKYLISLVPNGIINDRLTLSETFTYSTLCQNQVMMDYILELITFYQQLNPDYHFSTINILNNGLLANSQNGNIKLFDYLISLNANKISKALYLAANYNQVNLINHIISNCGDYITPQALYGAISGGHFKLVNQLLEFYPDLNNIYIYNQALAAAVLANRQSMADYFISLGATNAKFILKHFVGLDKINFTFDVETSDTFSDIGITDLYHMLDLAVENDQINVVTYILTNGHLLKEKYSNITLPTINQLVDLKILSYLGKHQTYFDGIDSLINSLISSGVYNFGEAISDMLVPKYLHVEIILLVFPMYKNDNPEIQHPSLETIDRAVVESIKKNSLEFLKYLIEYRLELAGLPLDSKLVIPNSVIQKAISVATKYRRSDFVKYLESI